MSLIFICISLILSHSNSAFPGGNRFDVSKVKSCYLEDAKTGVVIIKKYPEIILPAASTIKMVTAMIARNIIKDDDIITISRAATRVEHYKLRLRTGEKYYFRDLLKAMIINSANDAAMAIAVHALGNKKNFVERMNLWCLNHGILRTKLNDPYGVSPHSVSTSIDLLKIYKEFITDPKNANLLKTKYSYIRSLSGRLTYLKNTNNIYRYIRIYSGELYGKTGFTRKAGYCFVGQVKYDNNEYYLVVMGAKTAWHQIFHLIKSVNYLYKEVNDLNK